MRGTDLAKNTMTHLGSPATQVLETDSNALPCVGTVVAILLDLADGPSRRVGAFSLDSAQVFFWDRTGGPSGPTARQAEGLRARRALL